MTTYLRRLPLGSSAPDTAEVVADLRSAAAATGNAETAAAVERAIAASYPEHSIPVFDITREYRARTAEYRPAPEASR